MAVYQNSVAAPRAELTQYVMEGTTTDGMFIGQLLLPAVPLELPTGHYPKIQIGSGDLMRAASATRAPGTPFNRWQADVSDGNLTLVQIGEEIPIPDEQSMLYKSYFDLEQVFSLEGRRRVQRQNELMVESAMFNSAAGAFDAVNSAVAYITANNATISFIADVLAAIRRVKARGELANTIVIPGVIYDVIRLGTLVQAFIAGANQPGAVVNPNTIQRAFEEHGIKKVYIGDAYVNQSSPGDNSIINPIWPKTFIWVGAVAEGELQAGGVGRTFYWEPEGPLFNISSYREEKIKSNVVRCMTTSQAAITNYRAGTLITTQG